MDPVGARTKIKSPMPSGFMGWPPGTQRGRRGFSATMVAVGVHDGFSRFWETVVTPSQRSSSLGIAMG